MIIKMLLGSMHQSARTAPITKLDQIALIQLQDVMAEVHSAYENFEFYKAVNAINKWINTDLSAFYLEAMKDRLYCGDGGGVLEEIFSGLLKMLSPITPSLVEEAWDHRPEWVAAESHVHPSLRPLNEPIISPDRGSIDPAIRDDIILIQSANTAIKAAQEEARAKKLMGSSLECTVALSLSPEARTVFTRYAQELDSIFVVSSVELVDQDAEPEGKWKYSVEFDDGRCKASVLPPKDSKCPRCWRYVAPVDEPCQRCQDVCGECSIDV